MSKSVLVFDIEANGLLRQATSAYLLCIKDADTGEVWTYRKNNKEDTMRDGIAHLQTAHRIVAHNGVGYDVPLLHKLYGCELPVCIDTLLISRLLYPDIKSHPFGGNALADWGNHLGVPKMKQPDLSGGWSQEAETYCIQDVEVGTAIYHYLKKKAAPFREAIKLEHEVATILVRQYLNGFGFDQEAALKLQTVLAQERREIHSELAELFPSKWEEMKTPQYWEVWDYRYPTGKGELIGTYPTKTAAKKAGFKDPQIVRGPNKQKEHPFNPNSRQQIAERLIEKYDWKPKKKTEHGSVVIDEKVLSDLEYPEARLLERSLLIGKRESALDSWLKAVDEETGRIHGSVNTNGCVSGRMSHSGPNMAQIPAAYSPFGKECRRCFIPRDGWVLVGADASGLELRALAHELAEWDNGEYASVILDSDIHTYNQEAAGLLTRDQAKTFIYALMYGAWYNKLGNTVVYHTSLSEEQKATYQKALMANARKIREKRAMIKKRKTKRYDDWMWQRITAPGLLGKELYDQFMESLPAFAKLKDRAKEYAKRGYIVGLDGRRVPIRSEHMVINTIGQCHGAVIMKKALTLLDAKLTAFKGPYEFVGNIHDEWQIECAEIVSEKVGQVAVQSIKEAGVALGVRCPLDGEYKIGSNWSETH